MTLSDTGDRRFELREERNGNVEKGATVGGGNDFTLLAKAARESGLHADYYPYYAGSPGMLTALGDAALGHIKNVHVYAVNPPNERSTKYIGGYREKYKEDYIQSQHSVVIEMLAQATETCALHGSREGRAGARGHDL